VASGDVGPPRDPLATQDSLPTLEGAAGPLARARRLVVGLGLSLVLIIVMIGALVLVLQNTFRVAA
jgi:hypothetical protein